MTQNDYPAHTALMQGLSNLDKGADVYIADLKAIFAEFRQLQAQLAVYEQALRNIVSFDLRGRDKTTIAYMLYQAQQALAKFNANKEMKDD